MKKKFGIGTLLLASLLICMVFVSAASAQENLKTSDKSSELQQGLIDALNSDTKKSSTDEIVSNYCKANKDKISANNLAKSDTASSKAKINSYQLKDGSTITFTNAGCFYITEMKEEANNKIVTQNTATAKGVSTTPTIKASKSLYSWTGIKVYTLYTKGYFTYNGKTVDAHYIDSWYTRTAAVYWQVSNWKEGSYEYSSGTRSDIYGRGNFQWGLYVNGSGLVIREFYDNLYIKCDQYGKYKSIFEESAP